jgi:hypothetical protein
LLQARCIDPHYLHTEERASNKATVTAGSALSLLCEIDENAAGYAAAVLEDPQYTWREDIRTGISKENPAITFWSLHPEQCRIKTPFLRNIRFTSGPPTRALPCRPIL